ncbi:SLAM family member 5-like [Varanus komodoensis]|uniref:SLAM family member 5-like n=1 Tax=Varanus komodoensis TaxID=61221 RepID=UPI001CF78ED3|nr:SLAM family member 5-like [Varanus komodoensis]
MGQSSNRIPEAQFLAAGRLETGGPLHPGNSGVVQSQSGNAKDHRKPGINANAECNEIAQRRWQNDPSHFIFDRRIQPQAEMKTLHSLIPLRVGCKAAKLGLVVGDRSLPLPQGLWRLFCGNGAQRGRAAAARKALPGTEAHFERNVANREAMRSLGTHCLLLIACLLAETSGGNITAVLGGSATFQVETAKEFTLISWTRSLGRKGTEILAYLKPKPPCEATILIPAFSKRMNVSADCKQLHIHELRRTDSGLYTAQTQLQGQQEPLRQTFQLGVFKRLSEADLLLRCEGHENSTWLLSCSTQERDEGVEFSWAPTSSSVPAPGNPLLIRHGPQDPDLNVTCTARNPLGPASRTASLAQLCTAQAECTTARPVTESAWENGGGNGETTRAWVVVVTITFGLVLVALLLAVFWKKRGFLRKRTGFATPSEPKDGMTLYVQVESIPAQREPAKASQETAQALCVTVQHPVVNSLQTDDEKMQKERWRAVKDSDKTVYSEVQLQEKEDQNIKTVYETLNHPKPGGAL